ncbi:MAG: TspO/MBR family protein [Pseudomonadota bacterium]
MVTEQNIEKSPSNGLLHWLVAAGVAIAVSTIGRFLTDIGPWYRALQKSALNPPDWAFPVAWTLIYALAVVAAVSAWRGIFNVRERFIFVALFSLNIVLNLFWLQLFFIMKRPDLAMLEIVAFWASIVALILFLSRFSRLAGFALAPYGLWVTFASYLNFEIVRLNSPFVG